jgi:Arabinose-binding domain of AraC transcription regulator, N-term
MRARPMISAAVTTGLMDVVASAGADPAELLLRLKLDGSIFSQAEDFIACSDFARLLEEAALITSDDAFGLHFGARGNPKNIGPLAYAVLNAPTIAAAIEIAGRYFHVHNEAVNMSVTTTHQLVYLRYVHSNVGLDKPRQFNEYSMAMALNVMRMMVGSHWSPREVQFAHDVPLNVSEHLAVFGAPALFSRPTNAIVMEREFFDRTLPAADPRLFEIIPRRRSGQNSTRGRSAVLDPQSDRRDHARGQPEPWAGGEKTGRQPAHVATATRTLRARLQKLSE